jgi:hypothetical protein
MERLEVARRPDLQRLTGRVDIRTKRPLIRPRPQVLRRWAQRPYDTPGDVMTMDEAATFVSQVRQLERELEPCESKRAVPKPPPDPWKIVIPDIIGDRTDSSDPGDDFPWDWNAILAD